MRVMRFLSLNLIDRLSDLRGAIAHVSSSIKW